jgi:multiple sugar transport system substrate-binding protein
MRRFVFTALVLFLAIGLAFTSGQQEKKTTGKVFEGREIVVFSTPDGPPDNKRIGVYVPSFEEETGAKVQWVEMKPPDIVQKFSTMSAAQSSAVDVIGVGAMHTVRYAAAGWLEDITDELDQAHFKDLTALTASMYKGRLVGLPDSGDLKLFYWNKKLFREAGLDENAPPNTVDELITYSRKITKDTNGDGKADVFGFQPMGAANGKYTMFDYQMFYYQSGMDSFFDKNDNPIFNSPEGLKALKYQEQLYKEGLIDPAMWTITGYEEFFQRFSEGLSGMCYGWTSLWNYAKARPSSKIKDDVAITVMPQIKRRAGITGDQAFVISKFSKNKDVAVAFLKHINKPENTLDMMLRTGFLAGRKSVFDDPKVKNSDLAPMLVTAGKQLQYYNTRFAQPWTVEFEMEALGLSIVKVLKNEMTAEEALKWSEEKAVGLVKKYK